MQPLLLAPRVQGGQNTGSDGEQRSRGCQGFGVLLKDTSAGRMRC